MPLIKIKSLTLFLSILVLGMAFISMANAGDYQSKTLRHYAPSTTLTGITGLNIVPTSRMEKQGTMRIGVATTDPYIHSFLGFQIAKPLYINIRQTSEVSSLNDSAKALYPGLDFKLRLQQETAKRPEISIGANAAFGHKRTSSEYIALSKRKNNFDYTAGIAWGRLAGKGHIRNPLRAVSSHFGKNRNFNSNNAQNTDDWLTGEEIGFFGGVEYFTPFKGLSLKGEYGAYDYAPESASNKGFNDAEPWSLSLNYKPWKQTDLSLGIIGGEKIMGRLSLQNQIQNWPLRPSVSSTPPALLSPREDNQGQNKTALNLSAHQSIGLQTGRAARKLSNQAPANTENLEIALNHKGLRGTNLRLIRRDIEEAILNNHGSPEEIWRDINFIPNKTAFFSFKDHKKLSSRLILDNKISLSEEETNILYRSSAILELEKPLPLGILIGASPRINIADNLGRLRNIRPTKNNPTRSNEDHFSAQTLSVNRLYASWLYSLTQNTHINFSAGYLEEMFAGLGGEILHRPFGKTFTIGFDAWNVRKRDPFSTLNLQTENDKKFTGHLNLFYELPNQTTTLFAKAGRYLAQDSGATFGVKNQFKNGAKLEGFITATNKKESDIFGGTSQLYGGVKFTLPFGNLPFVPRGSEMRLTTAPFARDAGQVLNHPNKLYDVTEPISYRRLNQSWSDLLH